MVMVEPPEVNVSMILLAARAVNEAIWRSTFGK